MLNRPILARGTPSFSNELMEGSGKTTFFHLDLEALEIKILNRKITLEGEQ